MERRIKEQSSLRFSKRTKTRFGVLCGSVCREAGYSEREIIEQFGPPYDAAQRILNEDGGADEVPERKERHEVPPKPAPARDEYFSEPPRVYEARPCAKEEKRAKRKSKGKTSWVFILLCIIFAIPIFGIILALSAVTVAAFLAPFAVLIARIGRRHVVFKRSRRAYARGRGIDSVRHRRDSDQRSAPHS